MKEVIGITIFMLGLGLVGNDDLAEAERAHTHYCAMVDTWQRHQGTRGHPNYENRDCGEYQRRTSANIP